jgi:predicted nucleotidyltransferase
VEAVLRLIIDRAHPSKITLFGSRARGTARENSDFDFAVEGRTCSDEDWNRLLADISDEAISLHAIDIVESKDLAADYLNQIQHEGKVIYG